MKAIKVAIIEDDKTVNHSLKKAVEMQVMMELVFTSYSIEDALKRMELENKIDIILLDIGLPGMDGIEAIPVLKNKIPNLEIIMLSSYEESEKIFKALCAGACSYISKRTSLKKIMDAIHTVSYGGSYMSPSIARKIVDSFAPKNNILKDRLNERQLEVVKYLAEGMSYLEISKELHVSINTIRFHIKKIYEILQINSKMKLIKMYNE